eukprot:scaffold7431_cov185-Isochrysis_galbana.AAC.3
MAMGDGRHVHMTHVNVIYGPYMGGGSSENYCDGGPAVARGCGWRWVRLWVTVAITITIIIMADGSGYVLLCVRAYVRKRLVTCKRTSLGVEAMYIGPIRTIVLEA